MGFVRCSLRSSAGNLTMNFGRNLRGNLHRSSARNWLGSDASSFSGYLFSGSLSSSCGSFPGNSQVGFPGRLFHPSASSARWAEQGRRSDGTLILFVLWCPFGFAQGKLCGDARAPVRSDGLTSRGLSRIIFAPMEPTKRIQSDCHPARG